MFSLPEGVGHGIRKQSSMISAAHMPYIDGSQFRAVGNSEKHNTRIEKSKERACSRHSSMSNLEKDKSNFSIKLKQLRLRLS